MDVIQSARELGKAIQQDRRFISLQLAQQQNEDDAGLQDLIAQFEAGRKALNAENQKQDRNEEAVRAMDSEVRSLYSKIFENENMIRFSHARDEMNTLLQFVNQIIAGSAEGQDPDAIELQESCGGQCGGCAGCG